MNTNIVSATNASTRLSIGSLKTYREKKIYYPVLLALLYRNNYKIDHNSQEICNDNISIYIYKVHS